MPCYVDGCTAVMENPDFGLCRQHLDVLFFAPGAVLTKPAQPSQAIAYRRSGKGRYWSDQCPGSGPTRSGERSNSSPILQ